MTQADTIVVTGGAGYVGSHACKALAAANFTPVTVDNLSEGHLAAVQWGPFEQGDLADAAFLDRVFDSHRPAGVIHFAAHAYVGESVTDPAKYYRNNVAGTLSLLEACNRHTVGKLVFSSTCATYGVPVRTPIDESHPQAPINPYGETKLVVERMLRDFDAAYGLRSVSLRYFNAAGADPDGRIGEMHDPETHVIPLAIDAAMNGEPVFRVFGDDYDTEDGTAVRDYIHVDDLASAHVLAMRHLIGGGHTVAINLGTGIGNSVRQIIESVERCTGRSMPHEYAPRRAGDPPVLVADNTLARRLLGWDIKYTELDQIMATAVAWQKQMAERRTQ